MKRFTLTLLIVLAAVAAGAQTGPLSAPLEVTITVTGSGGKLAATATWPVPDYDIANHWDIDVYFFIGGSFARWQTVPLSRGWVALDEVDFPVMFKARHRELGSTLPCIVLWADSKPVLTNEVPQGLPPRQSPSFNPLMSFFSKGLSPWMRQVQTMTQRRAYSLDHAERVVADHAAEWTAARHRRAVALVMARSRVAAWAATKGSARVALARSLASLTVSSAPPKPTRANLWRAAIECRQVADNYWGRMRGAYDDGVACCGYDDGQAMMAEGYKAEAHGLMRAALRRVRLAPPVLEPHTLIGCGCPHCRAQRRNSDKAARAALSSFDPDLLGGDCRNN